MQWLRRREMETLADSTVAYPTYPSFCSDIGQRAFDIKEPSSGQPTHHLPFLSFEFREAFGCGSHVAITRGCEKPTCHGW